MLSTSSAANKTPHFMAEIQKDEEDNGNNIICNISLNNAIKEHPLN